MIQLSNLNRAMDRKQFFKTLGEGLAFIVGVSSLAGLVASCSENNKISNEELNNEAIKAEIKKHLETTIAEKKHSDKDKLHKDIESYLDKYMNQRKLLDVDINTSKNGEGYFGNFSLFAQVKDNTTGNIPIKYSEIRDLGTGSLGERHKIIYRTTASK